MKKFYSFAILYLVFLLAISAQETPILAPPTNFQGANPPSTDFVVLTWDMPVDAISGATPEGLMGYNVYRDGEIIAELNYLETMYDDLDLLMISYVYHISAVYDLTGYGFPGETGESELEGPVEVTLCCMNVLPFNEYFLTGLFETNQWETDAENWHIAGQMGNAAPCAEFNSLPLQTNYTFSLASAWLTNVSPDTEVFLEYDLMLDDNLASGTEKLLVEVYNGTSWMVMSMDSATGDRDWVTHQLNISSAVESTYLKVRFTASGVSSANINSWQVDNIKVYNYCPGPLSIAASVPYPETSPCLILLEWDQPVNTQPAATQYNVYRNDLLIATSDQNTYTDDIGSVMEAEVCYTVTALYPECESQFSNMDCIVPAQISCNVSVKEIDLGDVAIYPNPASSYVSISVETNVNLMSVYDQSGRPIASRKIEPGNHTFTFDVRSLENGIYYLRFTNDLGVSLGQKLVISGRR